MAKEKKACRLTAIGGQALLEGIMMKGPYKTLMAVRCKDGSIDLSDVKESHLKDKCSIFGDLIISFKVLPVCLPIRKS